MGKNGQIRITSRVSTFHLRINWRHKRVTLNDLFQESNRATISGRGGRERGGRRGGRFERRKARVEFRVRDDDSGGVVFLRVRARTGATPSPRSKAKYSGGTLTDEIVCNLGRVWPTPPTLSPTRESSSTLAESVARSYPLSPASQRKRVEAKYRAIMARDAHKPRLQLFRPRSPSTTLLSRKKEDRRLPRIGNPRGGNLAKVRCQEKASGNRVERDVASR